jgi:hypothetical protein
MARCHPEQGPIENELLCRLENKEKQGSGNLGTPCYSVWMADSHKRRLERISVRCGPAGKVKQQGSLAVKDMMGHGATLLGEEKVPSPEDHSGKKHQAGYLHYEIFLLAQCIICQVDLKNCNPKPPQIMWLL